MPGPKPATTCKRCGAPRWPQSDMALCEACHREYTRSYARKYYEQRHPSRHSITVVALDWRENQIVTLSATVIGSQPMPATYGELRAYMKQCALQGTMIAEHKPYKESD